MRLTTGGRQGRDDYLDADRPVSRGGVLAVVVVALTAIFWLDRITDVAPYQHLYYVPIVLAAARFGRRAGAVVALTAIVLYHLANPRLLTFHHEESDIVQIVLFAAVGLVSGKLAEDGRRLHRLAMTDDLTGLHNLRSFERRLATLMRTARVTDSTLALFVLDVDRLKSLNDTHGHLVGAEAVRTVGHLIAEWAPEDAVACRYGGDEFVVAVPECPATRAAALAETLRGRVHGVAPVLAGTAFAAGTLSISIGISCRAFERGPAVTEGDDRAGRAMFHDADKALYAAKAAGRNSIHLATP